MMRSAIQAACTCVVAALFFTSVAGLTTPGRAQSQQQMDEAMKQAMALATPGPEHQQLSRVIGNWSASIKMYMGPGEPTESRATATYASILGGRYIQGKFNGDFGGMPFEGLGIDGYDNAKKEYVSIWVDNMGTGVMHLTGQPTADGKGIDYAGMCLEPSLMKDVMVREEVRWISDEKFTFTMYMDMPGADGKPQQQRVMEMTAVRQ